MKKIIVTLATLLLVICVKSQTKIVKKPSPSQVKPKNVSRSTATVHPSKTKVVNKDAFEGAEKALLLEPKTKPVKN